MEFKLEQLEYQQQAISSVINIFAGQVRNTFDNSSKEGIRTNYFSLLKEEFLNNIKSVIADNGISEEAAKISESNDVCIEMETGTGKTLVYLKTIYELFKHYGFTKFIILIPSVAIKEGVLKSFEIFEKQLEDIYNIKLNCFEYNSKRLSKVTNFVEDNHPQIMVMTLQSFNTDDKILNQAQREDLFSNLPYVEALSRTNPIIIMDEPQEGMDSENSKERIKSLNPLIKIRYSATHKKEALSNLIYRLTPYDSYKQGLVKKIEVLTVSEKNDEASMKIELSKIEIGKGEPKVILRLWFNTTTGFKFKNTKKLEKNSELYKVSNNIIYNDYIIEQIAKPIRGKGFVKFSNGATIYENEQAKDYSSIFNEQLYWLIDTHFIKKKRLEKIGVKCLSLIFIDKVDNYIKNDGIIKKAFETQFKKCIKEKFNKTPSKKEILDIQGYYFAQTNRGDFTDDDRSMKNNKELYDLILKEKEKLLTIGNPVEFIFSHSALGVGWDNPNVFNIATLNQSYSEIKKRQEIGRGLRICINQEGQRVYDKLDIEEGEEINLLTVIPNETYETFVSQYQSEIEEIYGTTKEGAETRHTHKGKKKTEKKIKRNESLFNSQAFKKFWKRLSKKTEYLVSFDEEKIINDSINALNEISISEHQLEISLGRIETVADKDFKLPDDFKSEAKSTKIEYAQIDIIEEISENTSLAYPTTFKIIDGIENYEEIIKNPPRFIQEAIKRIKNIELNEMLRALEYKVIDAYYDISQFPKSEKRNTNNIQPTPKKGIYDKIVWDSNIEQCFASDADNDPELVCFLKLPYFYEIKTPVGNYTPDFGIVIRKQDIRNNKRTEYNFVIETKGTNDINDRKSLSEDEIYKIKCAVKHFEALGIETKINYIAPIKEYTKFKSKSEEVINENSRK